MSTFYHFQDRGIIIDRGMVCIYSDNRELFFGALKEKNRTSMKGRTKAVPFG